MKYAFASPGNIDEIKKLLAANDLIHDDITTDLLEHFLLVWEQARLVGAVGLERKGSFALLRSLVVKPEYRNKGLASELVENIEHHACSLKIDSLYLLTMTAERFFAKRGYRKTMRDAAPASIQETAEFKGLCPTTAVCMVKVLNVEAAGGRAEHPSGA